MRSKSNWGWILSGASVAAMTAAAQPATAQEVSTEIVVTAQKREQAIQDVPIAVSAFGQTQLEAQGLDGGYDLVQAIPNVSFSKANFTTYNFQIRGVGYKNVSSGSDQGVGVHINNAPLTTNRLFEADFYDVDRVEVLRGPQGTLYGRNATGGVVNVITRQPTGDFGAMLRGEVANHESTRFTGWLNIPILDNDRMALRVAGTRLSREGFGTNTVTNEAIDGREIWAGRATLSFNPTDNVSTWISYEHFEEDDNRARVNKQLCATDNGRTSVNGRAITNPVTQGFFSQGCLPVPLDDPSALGAVNTLATLGGTWGAILGYVAGNPALSPISSNPNAGVLQDPDLRNIQSVFEPVYQAEQDLAMFNIAINLSDGLTLTSLTSWNKDSYFTFQDYNRIVPVTPFNNVPGITPNRTFCDPQLGCRDRVASADISSVDSEQWTQELRLQSDFDGPLNFSLGGIYLDYQLEPNDYWVFSNTLSITTAVLGRPFLDTANPPTGNGHNYYLNRTALYQLKAWAAMGEVYYEPFDDFTITLGLRYTDDKKDVFPKSPLLFGFLSGVTTPPPVPHQQAEFKETTGRLGFDWHITDDTLLYAFYSRGYKGGGFNPPSSVGIAGITTTFDPEFVNAIEAGVKNTLMDGRMLLNATGFHYDYEGYQISRIVQRNSVNENIDAEVQGAEFELTWELFDGFRLNGTLGYLDTSIADGESSLDVFNRAQGNTAYTYIKDPFNGQGCLAPTAAFIAPIVAAINANPAALGNACTATGSPLGIGAGPNAPFRTIEGAGPAPGGGVFVSGNQLPNAPEWTFNIGAQYTWALGSGWEATARADYYQQGESFARIFNTPADRLEGYYNLNLLLRVENPEKGLNLELFMQNATDEEAITDAYLTDDSSGLFRNIFLTDPRIFGLRLSKEFGG